MQTRHAGRENSSPAISFRASRRSQWVMAAAREPRRAPRAAHRRPGGRLRALRASSAAGARERIDTEAGSYRVARPRRRAQRRRGRVRDRGGRCGCPTSRSTTPPRPPRGPARSAPRCCSSRARARRAGAASSPRPPAASSPSGSRSASAAGAIADPVARAGPSRAARSPGFASRQRSSDRQPQPMHSVSPRLQPLELGDPLVDPGAPPRERRDQSRFVGARSGGSLASSPAISSRVRPTRWAKTMNAIRRSTDAGSGGGRSRRARRRSARAPRRSAAPRPRRRCAARPHRSSAARPSADRSTVSALTSSSLELVVFVDATDSEEDEDERASRQRASGSSTRSPRGPGWRPLTGSRGELSLRLGRREIGHLHGDHAMHAGFPKAVWHELHDAGPDRLPPRLPRQARLRRRGGSRARMTSAT